MVKLDHPTAYERGVAVLIGIAPAAWWPNMPEEEVYFLLGRRGWTWNDQEQDWVPLAWRTRHAQG